MTLRLKRRFFLSEAGYEGTPVAVACSADGSPEYVLDAVCFVYTCRRLIDLSVVAGTRLGAAIRRSVDPSSPPRCATLVATQEALALCKCGFVLTTIFC